MIDIQALSQQRPIIVVGAAFGDVMLGLDCLPSSGGDVVAQEQDRQIGGCAFNVARALSRLALIPINAIPVGNGSWGQLVETEMDKEGLPVMLRHPTHDNGWCIAMVEPNKERTFITVDGCEQFWSEELLAQIPTPDNAIVYVSGYELVSPQSEPLRQWLLGLSDDKTLFVDFGPRLADIDPAFVEKLLAKRPVLTLNRDELALLQGVQTSTDDAVSNAQSFAKHHNLAVICRFDKDGAHVCEPELDPVYIPAFQVDVADTIAAGDSHCAGVIAALASGLALGSATQLGNMVAAIVVSKPGSDGAPNREELAAFQTSQNADSQ
ncbi:PfkB family carbohydrate kinase [Photobacterium rosenbergii]|uniref:PfkB family carbohydrate kinase n=1 Tax=Photobacterium rosenbergii TaxID=294936 RepID=UPI00191C7E37|nr:PfkB family carbohydrate kinase [Photobacterium rosenbergii]